MVRVLSFGDAIAEKDESVSWLKLHSIGGKAGFLDQSHWKRAFRVQFADLAAPQQQWRRMTCLDVVKHAVAINQAEEHGCIVAHLRVFAEELIDLLENSHRIAAQGHSGKRSL